MLQPISSAILKSRKSRCLEEATHTLLPSQKRQENQENQENHENQEKNGKNGKTRKTRNTGKPGKQVLERDNTHFASKAYTSLYIPILNPFLCISCKPVICNFFIHAKLFPKQSKFVWHIAPHPQKRYFSSIQMKRQNSHHYFKIIQTKKVLI